MKDRSTTLTIVLCIVWPFTSQVPAEETPSDAQAFTNTLGMQFRRIPAGEFLMGDERSAAELKLGFGGLPEDFDNSDESPRHKVRITRPFYMGVYEVTKEQFVQFIAAERYRTDAEKDGEGGEGYDSRTANPIVRKPEFNWRHWGVNQNARSPVVNVSWNDATAFCHWLSKKEGKHYRLPTEAEWEYACRAGTTTQFSNGDSPAGLSRIGNVFDISMAELLNRGAAVDVAVIDNLASEGVLLKARDGWALIAPAGRFRPNAFGLYDMHGNASEWCSDWYDGDYYAKSPVDDPQGPAAGSSHVVRGGGWGCGPVLCRSAHRGPVKPAERGDDVGFRVVCER